MKKLLIKKIKKMKCPTCDKEMVKRKRKKDGHEFYGCSQYPKCTDTINLNGDHKVSDLEIFLYEEYIRDMGDR